MKILITGATGVAGSAVLDQALLDPEITQITALVRSPLRVSHPKLIVLLHQDFLSYGKLASVLQNQDACLWCLGIAQSLVSEAEYQVITYEYTLAAARALLSHSPQAAFVFLSGMGADSQEKSRTLFARIKGKTENALLKLPFRSLVIARPGGIRPTQPRIHGAWYEKAIYPFYPLLETLFPHSIIGAPLLAKALLRLAKEGSVQSILENPALRRLGEVPLLCDPT